MTRILIISTLLVFAAANAASAQTAGASTHVGPNFQTGVARARGVWGEGRVHTGPDFAHSRAVAENPHYLSYASSIAQRTPFGVESASFGLGIPGMFHPTARPTPRTVRPIAPQLAPRFVARPIPHFPPPQRAASWPNCGP